MSTQATTVEQAGRNAQSLTLSELRKTYLSKKGDPFEAVKGIEMAIDAGELVALLGPSGCGKTTTLRMIAGLETVTSGDIRIGDRSVAQLPPGKRNVGVGFESYALYPPLTVRENLAYGLKARGRKDSKERVAEMARRLEMEDMLHLRPASLSSGQKQRVALARALIRNPPVLLLDEPLSHLDAAQRNRVRRELKVLQREFGYTTIVVTHDQLEALSLADRMAVMDGGVIKQFGTPDEIFDDPANQFVADFVGEPKINLVEGVAERPEGPGDAGSPVTVRVGRTGSLQTSARTPENGRPVIVGIRPQDCSTLAGAPVPGESYLEGVIRVYEDLLEFGQATVDVQGVDGPVVVQTEPDDPWRSGDVIRFRAAPERVYLFDPETGVRVR